MAQSGVKTLPELERMGDVCTCGRVRISYIDGDWLPNLDDDKEAERCAACGCAVPVVVVRFGSDWRAVGEPVR